MRAAAFAVLLVGCFDAHGADAGTARGFDSGPRLDAADPCVVAARWYRCGSGECSMRCGGRVPGTYCDFVVGLCLPGVGAPEGCELVARPWMDGEGPVTICRGDGACWFDGDAAPVHGETGDCVPEDVCLADGLPPHRCFWPDGSEVQSPRRTPCPDWTDLDDGMGRPVTCGQSDCPYPHCGRGSGCAGRSDTRSFGLCTTFESQCNSGDDELVLACEGLLFAPCACMVSVEQGPHVEEPFGYVVPRAACERYAATFPGEVRCL